jgi:hypothetical protein
VPSFPKGGGVTLLGVNEAGDPVELPRPFDSCASARFAAKAGVGEPFGADGLTAPFASGALDTPLPTGAFVGPLATATLTALFAAGAVNPSFRTAAFACAAAVGVLAASVPVLPLDGWVFDVVLDEALLCDVALAVDRSADLPSATA